jgi:nitrogen regulatory protein PII
MSFVVTVIKASQIGGGKPFVLDLQGAVRIRPGEADTAAI